MRKPRLTVISTAQKPCVCQTDPLFARNNPWFPYESPDAMIDRKEAQIDTIEMYAIPQYLFRSAVSV